MDIHKGGDQHPVKGDDGGQSSETQNGIKGHGKLLHAQILQVLSFTECENSFGAIVRERAPITPPELKVSDADQDGEDAHQKAGSSGSGIGRHLELKILDVPSNAWRSLEECDAPKLVSPHQGKGMEKSALTGPPELGAYEREAF
jgi:hypothetical protein